MNDFWRPLLAFKKYWIAHKVLKNIGRPTIWHSEPRKKGEDLKKVYKVTFSRFSVSDIMIILPEISPFRIMEVITLLAENNHIETIKNEDLNEYSVFCTKYGESALHEGVYIKKVYLFWCQVIGIPGGIVGIIALAKTFL